MPPPIPSTIPLAQLRRLEFLLGETKGLETLYPPQAEPVQFQAHVSAQWEPCERFVRLSFFGDIPGLGVETFHALITYSVNLECYRMWIFSASQEEPLHLLGHFEGVRIVFVSDPTKMVWGMQRLRFTMWPTEDGHVELLGERWEPDGYAKYCSVIFRPESEPV